MATFGTRPQQGIGGVNSRAWEGFVSKNVTAGLPVPDFAVNNVRIGDFMADAPVADTIRGLSDAPTAVPRRAVYNDQCANLGSAPKYGQSYGFDWFEKIHIFPKVLALGNVISDIVEVLDIYSAYRNAPRVLTTFTNNAGAGITTDLSGLPKTVAPQSSLVVNVTVTTDGPPVISGTLDFVFDVRTALVPISGTRITLFEFPPQTNAREQLEFLTNVIKAYDGTEQRIALRQFPRHRVGYKVITASDADRNKLNSFMVDWSSRLFAVPLWWDARRVTSNIAVNDTVLNVISTDYAAYRVGGLLLVMQVDTDGTRTTDVVEVSALTSTTITLTSGVQNTFNAAYSFVVPAVPGVLGTKVPKSRYPNTVQEMNVNFLLVDNQDDLSSTAAFDAFNGRVLIDDTNFIDGKIQESFERKIIRIDNNTGAILQTSGEDRAVINSSMRWEVESAQRLWEIRQLLHALKGQQVSFYQPTFNKDFNLAAPASSGASTIDVDNIGYTTFVKAREPYNAIRIVLSASAPAYGSPEVRDDLLYIITGSSVVSDTVERLSFAGNLPLDLDSTRIERIEYLMLNRISDDTIDITHRWNDMEGQVIDAAVDMVVKGVFDG